ncbi:Epsin-2 [Cichlidogyrus casuarinus]|uniref:Epsin-2 n=1 Tax=Cichlidogyrus casuarinus TaxID=1844966 RepID=A0ABD2QBU7_9PLAT
MPTTSTNPFPALSSNTSTVVPTNGASPLINFDAKPVASNDPWALVPSTSTIPSQQLQNGSIDQAVWNVDRAFAANEASPDQGQQESSTSKMESKSQTKDPAAFLGEHSSLVNLDKLVERNPQSTNPFAPPPKPPIMGAANPFMSSNAGPAYGVSTMQTSGFMQPMQMFPMSCTPALPAPVQTQPKLLNTSTQQQQYLALSMGGNMGGQQPAGTASLNPFL